MSNEARRDAAPGNEVSHHVARGLARRAPRAAAAAARRIRRRRLAHGAHGRPREALTMKRRTIVLAIVIIVLAIGGYAATAAPSGTRSMKQFEPERLRGPERRMWEGVFEKRQT